MKIYRVAQVNSDEQYYNLLKAKDYKNVRKMILEKARQNGYSFGPVYHGTTRSFNKFDLNHHGRTDDGYYGKGFYFTMNKEYASEFGGVHNFLLSISNPLKLPESGSMGHPSLIKARDILGKVMDKPDLIPNHTLPSGYEVKKVKQTYCGNETGKDEYVVYPKEELYGTEQEIYGKGEPTPEEAIVSFNDELKGVSWNFGWLFGLTKDVGRDEMMKAIKAKGYDALLIESVDSNEIEEIIVWSPYQIKSFDIKTMDGKEIIPLSMRFNPQNEDFRY